MTLTATPAAGAAFASWSEDCAGTNPTCTLSMTQDRVAKANFLPGQLLTVQKYAETRGLGTVTSSPARLAVARALYAALEAGKHGDDLRTLFTPDAVVVERPNLLKPAGATSGLEDMVKAASAGASLLAWQKYEVRSAIEQGPLAVLRLTWTAKIARDAGPFRKCQKLTAHIAQFVETRDGLVAGIETFDCYEAVQLSTGARHTFDHPFFPLRAEDEDGQRKRDVIRVSPDGSFVLHAERPVNEAGHVILSQQSEIAVLPVGGLPTRIPGKLDEPRQLDSLILRMENPWMSRGLVSSFPVMVMHTCSALASPSTSRTRAPSPCGGSTSS